MNGPAANDSAANDSAAGRSPLLAVAICTYKRDEPLARTLDSLAIAHREALAAGVAIDLSVTVMDDDGSGGTRQFLKGLSHPFPVHYEVSASGNISRARNSAIAAALPGSDWLGMLDDDVVVPPNWLTLAAGWLTRPEVDAVTGACLVVFPDGPKWLREEPFQQDGAMEGEDGRPTGTCASGNCIMRSAWLREHPQIRFADDLGTLGGEDMVFFRTATSHGLRAVFLNDLAVSAVEPAERATFGYQMRRGLWIGNSEAVTNLRLGHAGRARLAARGAKRMVRALGLEKVRVQRRPPYLTVRRYPLYVALRGLGMIAGAMGVELAHR